MIEHETITRGTIEALDALTRLEFAHEPASLDEALGHLRGLTPVLVATEASRASSAAAELALVTLRLLLADEDAVCVGGPGRECDGEYDGDLVSAPLDAAALALLWVLAESAPELWPDAAAQVLHAPGVRWARRFACARPGA